jgi:hypothetical protein
MTSSMGRSIICCDASEKVAWLLDLAVSTALSMCRGTQSFRNHVFRGTANSPSGNETWPLSHCGAAAKASNLLFQKHKNMTMRPMTRSSERSDSFIHASPSTRTLLSSNLTTTYRITTKQSTKPKAQQTHLRKTWHSSHNSAQPKPSAAEDAPRSPRS